VTSNPGLTEVKIAQSLFGDRVYQGQVNFICRRLVKQGRIKRDGKGGKADPFTYHPKSIKRR
jgi:hypothetical protein